MDNEEDKKGKIFNSINMNKKDKKKYYRVEKNRFNASTLREKEIKKIFKTQKEYHLSKRKALRELRRLKFLKNKKFITTTKEKEKENDNNEKENNSFVVQRIIPKKLKIIKQSKKESKDLNFFSKSNENLLFNEKNPFLQSLFNKNSTNSNSNNENSNSSNNCNIENDEKNLNCYKLKLMLVYFYSIKNLCKYINNNFFNTSLKEQKTIDDFIYQIYQSLQILDRKINQFNIFQHLKDDIRVNKDDFYDISSLKENLLFMKNVLNNSMSQNLINICADIDNFCQIYSSS
jgi:hypothetical protein